MSKTHEEKSCHTIMISMTTNPAPYEIKNLPSELVQLTRSLVFSRARTLKDVGMAEHAGRVDLGIHGSELQAYMLGPWSIFAVTPKSNVF